MPRPARSRASSDSFDDAFDPDPPAEPPNLLVLVGVWAIFGLPLLIAVPVLLAGESGGFEAMMRVLAGGYAVVAGIVLWGTTRRYLAASRDRKPAGRDDGPEAEDEEDVFDDDAEEI